MGRDGKLGQRTVASEAWSYLCAVWFWASPFIPPDLLLSKEGCLTTPRRVEVNT